MRNIGDILPVLIASGILLAGNGLQGTLIAVRGGIEGFSPTVIGLFGTTYYLGMLLGCRYGPQVIGGVGHIRAFAAFAAIAASAALFMILVIDPFMWMGMRFATGFSFAVLSMAIESWLNERAGNADRGRVLGLYRTVDLCAVTGAQFLLPVFGAASFALFCVVAIFFCIALVPVSLSRGPSPKPPEVHGLLIKRVWLLSPLAVAGCLTIGLTNSAFRLVGPVYASDIGMDAGQIAIFVSAGVVGGALLQLPLGWLSDRYNRRWIVVLATSGAALGGFLLSLLDGSNVTLIYLGALMFGAFALPLYSLSIAHASDLVEPGEFVSVSASLMFVFGLGASIGPFAASVVIEQFGPQAIFTYTTAMHGGFLLFVLYRLRRRPQVPTVQRSRFTAFMRTSPAIFRLARKSRDE